MSIHRTSFIRLFKDTARYHNRYEVFRDAITCIAYSLHNSVSFCQKVEDDYLRIARRYKEEDLRKMSGLMSHIVMALDEKPCDFLGSLFEELELGSSHTGQFFTPFELASLMARLQIADADVENRYLITLHEPSCGSGSMIIAYALALMERGINYQQRLWVQAIDVDPLPALMAYVQLTLLHIPAEICIGNTLSMNISQVFRTPAYYIGSWEQKLKAHYATKECAVLLSQGEETKSIPIEQLDLLGLIA